MKKQLTSMIKPIVRRAQHAMRLHAQAHASRKMSAALGKRAIGIVAQTDQGLFAVDPGDMAVGRSLLQDGRWGTEEISLLNSYIQPDSDVLILGGHVGSIAVPLARAARSVTIFEPNPVSHRLLRINLALNRIENATVVEAAASNSDEPVTFLLSRANSGGSKRKPKATSFWHYYDDPEETSVRAVVLDEYLTGASFDVIVMDIEGGEYFALQGMQRLLADARVLQIEFMPLLLKNVAGCSVTQYLGLISPHFDRLRVPSTGVESPIANAGTILDAMYARNLYDDGLLFTKVAAPPGWDAEAAASNTSERDTQSRGATKCA